MNALCVVKAMFTFKTSIEKYEWTTLGTNRYKELTRKHADGSGRAFGAKACRTCKSVQQCTCHLF